MKRLVKVSSLALFLFLILSIQISSIAHSQEDSYFPKGIFNNKFNFDYEKFFTTELIKAQEPNIYTIELDENIVVYRLLIIRSLSAFPIIVRIEIDTAKNSGVAVFKTGGLAYSFYQEFFTATMFLDSDKCEEFLNVINRYNFWNIPSTEISNSMILPDGKEYVTSSKGIDGEEWIIEGRYSDVYHALNRYSSELDGRNGSNNQDVYLIGKYMESLFPYHTLKEENIKIIEQSPYRDLLFELLGG